MRTIQSIKAELTMLRKQLAEMEMELRRTLPKTARKRPAKRGVS